VIFLDESGVLRIHRALAARFGGVATVRDAGLLASAVGQPRQSFGGDYLHAGICSVAAAYAFHLIADRPFVEGNRRTAAACAGVFLSLNGRELDCDPHVLFRAMVTVGEGLMSEATLARFFEVNSIAQSVAGRGRGA
jgi:death-on-curing protein